MERVGAGDIAFWRTWHIQDSQCQILALAFRRQSFNVERVVAGDIAFGRIWHIQDSHGQILALAFRRQSVNVLSCSLVARKRCGTVPCWKLTGF